MNWPGFIPRPADGQAPGVSFWGLAPTKPFKFFTNDTRSFPA